MQRSDLLKAALELPSDERERLAQELWASIESEGDEVERAWASEIERRLDEAEAGSVQTVPWPEVHAEALDVIRRVRGR